MRYLNIIVFFLIIIVSCKKQEEQLVKNYYSCGVINTEVLSHTSTQAVVKVRFFVLDKSNNGGLIRQNILNNITPISSSAGNSEYKATLDSFRIITTPNKGNSSTAVLISDGLDETINMEDYEYGAESTVRKILHSSVPNNEVLLAKVSNEHKPIEIINNGYTKNANELDLKLAEIYKNGNYTATDTLPLLNAIDSLIDYMNVKSTYSNKNVIILYSRRVNFLQNINSNTLIYKAKQNNISFHFVELAPTYTWSNIALRNFMVKLNAVTNGVYFEKNLYSYYNYDDGELPMEVLQFSGKLPKMLEGNFQCFEAIWTINTTSTFSALSVYTTVFSIKLSTNFEQKDIDVPFYYYINL